IKPEEVEPGIANWYASTFQSGDEYCSVVVKTREGRPIKIEGNKLSGVTFGGTSARAQASVLSLYDNTRLKGFLINNTKATHEEVDKKVIAELQNIKAKGGNIRIVSNTIFSPSTKSVINDFIATYPTAKHITYDPVSAYGILAANKAMFGKAVIPSYKFDKANVIVSFGADFLGTWISPIEYARLWAAGRKLSVDKNTMSRHYQFESQMSLTGCNADVRVPIKPSMEGVYLATLYKLISGIDIGVPTVDNDVLKALKNELLANKGQSLVVSGSNDINIQLLVNEINRTLNNYDATIDLTVPSYQKQGNDVAMVNFIKEVNAGQIDGVIFYNCNPVYDHPMGASLAEGLKKVGLKIATSERANETALACTYVCPDHHYLEAWNDAEPKKGFYSLGQPTITPLFKTRAGQESLLVWAGKPADYYEYVKKFWKSNILNGQKSWEQALQDGVFEVAAASATTDTSNDANFTDVPAYSGASSIGSPLANKYKVANKGIELKIYEKVGLGYGTHSNNPWLQELPDPVTKVTWDNYASLPVSLANELGVKMGDMVTVTYNGKTLPKALPVLIQPGQAGETVAIALGYGRTAAGKVGDNVGVDVYPFVNFDNSSLDYTPGVVTVAKATGTRKLAQTQTHHTLMARPIVQDATLAEYQKDPYAGRYMPLIHTHDGPKRPEDPAVDIWYDHAKPNHHWNMVIDLNSCIGCGACVVGCQAENNIPVVGRQEVLNRREMHWIRIDRYYSSDAERPELGSDKYFQSDEGTGVKDLEIASANPQVTFQPMLCQHCNHAPCETVCPVAATTHSSEGLNQMAYNRCFGTRYCANNCPYKVRRFNWFKYFENDKFATNISMNTTLGRMVLNPDVTVRSRGVMEKCTFCVQRIQDGKLKAKKEKRKLADQEVNTACASACPTGAIIFGDINNPDSLVYQQITKLNKPRAYHVLEELNVRPNISYLTKIRNINKA
ncbi:MAG TPA: 4Fe-4S dicluster domain-containing protein, partial [Cytophagaceae bacterium]